MSKESRQTSPTTARAKPASKSNAPAIALSQVISPDCDPANLPGQGILFDQAAMLNHLDRPGRQRSIRSLNQALGNHYVLRLVDANRQPQEKEIDLANQKKLARLNPSNRNRVMRYDVDIAEAGPGGFSTESLTSIRVQLSAWGVRDPGDLNTLNIATNAGGVQMGPFTRAQIQQALGMLETLRSMGGRGGAAATTTEEGTTRYPSRILAAWNNRLDDLGPSTTYPTIIHFVMRIEQLAQSSMGMSYLAAIRAMPTVTLAGAEVAVHSRAIYFTAVAQALMDQTAGIEIGEGHYIAPGAYLAELKRIRNRAREMARAPQQPRRRRAPPPEPTQADMARARAGAAAYNLMVRQIANIIETMRNQEQGRATPTSSPSEHREPGLRNYLNSHTGLANLTEITDENPRPEVIRSRAQNLVSQLGEIPWGQRGHGFGSVDPHGTDHALGLAIDLFNGAGASGAFQNFGVQSQFIPFLQRLVNEYGSAELRRIPFRAMHELTPANARALSSLVAEHGAELVQRLRSEISTERPNPSDTRARQQRLGVYRQIAQRTLAGYFRRQQIITMALSRRRQWFSGQEAFRQRARQILVALQFDRRSFTNLPPREVLEGLRERIQSLNQLCQQGRAIHSRISASQQRSQTTQEEDLNRQITEITTQAEGRRLSRAEIARRNQLQARLRTLRRQNQAANRRLADDLGVIDDLDPATAARGTRALADQERELAAGLATMQADYDRESAIINQRLINTPEFNRWFRLVSNPEHPIYDQPDIVINAINAVVGHSEQAVAEGARPPSHFYGGHHWQVVERGILEQDPSRYQAALTRDMQRRGRLDLMPRILAIMAESEGGYQILSTREASFMAALNTAFPGQAEGLVAAAINRVRGAGVGEGAGADSQTAAFLRQHGFHYLAGDQPEEGETTATPQPAR